MTMIFRDFKTPGIAQLSYLIGDDSAGTAAVVDPQPDVDMYIDAARESGVAITHVFETHIHADFMSGARELHDRLDDAKLLASGEGDAEYGFDLTTIGDGDHFDFGTVRLTARHTPGHTPEHVSYELAMTDDPENPWAVLSGDSLFVGSAGRPDLIGDDQTEALVQKLYDTLYDYYLGLADGVIVYPCHGAGSACGADIGERPMTTVGFERRTNPFLQHEDFDSFRSFVLDEDAHVPHHYAYLKKINAKGPQILGNLPPIAGMTSEEFQKATDAKDAQLVDTRQMLSFGGGHVPGAINIGDRPELSVWAGEMLDHEKPLYIVVEDETQLSKVMWLFVNTGFLKFGGFLVGGMKAWQNAGLPLARTTQLTVHELREAQDKLQVLDVRSEKEWESGHIPGATHYFVADMRDDLDGLNLDKDKPVAAYCGSGYRANIAASLLQRNGYSNVSNVPGSWGAWQKADYPVEK